MLAEHLNSHPVDPDEHRGITHVRNLLHQVGHVDVDNKSTAITTTITLDRAGRPAPGLKNDQPLS